MLVDHKNSKGIILYSRKPLRGDIRGTELDISPSLDTIFTAVKKKPRIRG